MTPRRTSRAGLVADVINIRTRRPVRDLEAVLAKLDRPMSELEVVLHARRDAPKGCPWLRSTGGR
jgi:hypothetical protein